jgi:quercetin dioxygenase-like cupin family protein
MVQPTRRIVTGHDERGRSVFVEDRPSPNVHVFERFGGTAVTELWSTPEPGEGQDAAAGAAYRLEPELGATKFRVVEYPPDSVRFAGVDRIAAYAAMGARHAVVEGARHPGMHKTRSIDYAIVLSGEIWALMDEGEVLMKAGDCLVQRGTSHAWSNRTDKPARVAFVLVGSDS